MTHDLVAWLNQQRDARETLAQAAAAEYPGDTGLHWEAGNGSVWPANPVDNNPVADTAGWGALGDATAQHIADNDPARILAAVDIERRILDLHSPDAHGYCPTCDDNTTPAPCDTLRLLAALHAHQPGYRKEWGPQ